MRKFFISKVLLFLVIVLVFSVGSFILWQYTNPTNSIADTYYNSINCPTPAGGRNTLQLVPCTPAGAVSPTTFTAQTQQPGNTAVTAPAPNTPNTPKTPSSGTVSGPVCTPDSQIAPGASCKCQSDLEPDAVCTVPSAQTCVQNGGITGSSLAIIGSGLGGAQNSNISIGNTGGNGPVQCLWLDTAPVPAAAQATNCSIECNSKPVLYFYSPTTKDINVSLNIPGFITASIPTYPADGWKHVIVHPEGTTDGTLVYNNKTYKELYYEDATIKATPPKEGFVIKKADLTPELREYTTKLGLNTAEQNEFLEYWVPRLTQLNAPYIFFTVFDQTQKEKVDHVIVSPQPQTTIAFLAYFKPLATPITVAPLQFPAVPERQGFTMVEWGGTIENN